jgi:hypothetical protein
MSNIRKFGDFDKNKKVKILKEHQEHQNYMFFANIQNIKRMCDEILEMDADSVDKILSDGHNWALDHISTSKDDMEEVYGFLMTHDAEGHDHDEDGEDVDDMPEEGHEEEDKDGFDEMPEGDHEEDELDEMEEDEDPKSNIKGFDEFQ